MHKKKALVTGSCGLIGSEVCVHFSRAGYEILGVDNNQRAVFFGPEGDTSWSLTATPRAKFQGTSTSIATSVTDKVFFSSWRRPAPDVIVHTAAQPSHDRAAQIAFDDFDTNAGGTLNLLEAATDSMRPNLRSFICRPTRCMATDPITSRWWRRKNGGNSPIRSSAWNSGDILD